MAILSGPELDEISPICKKMPNWSILTLKPITASYFNIMADKDSKTLIEVGDAYFEPFSKKLSSVKNRAPSYRGLVHLRAWNKHGDKRLKGKNCFLLPRRSATLGSQISKTI